MNITQIQTAIECSEAMLRDAEAGNWSKVIEMEEYRRELLNELFSDSGTICSATEMDKQIQKIIAINSKLEAAAVSARDSVASDINSISRGRNALDSYTKHTA